jgi:hypothetical protein
MLPSLYFGVTTVLDKVLMMFACNMVFFHGPAAFGIVARCVEKTGSRSNGLLF